MQKSYRCIAYQTEEENGKEVTKEEVFEKAETLIFPIPMFRGDYLNVAGETKCKAEDVLKLLKKGQNIYGGCIPAEIKKAAHRMGVSCHDYMEEESIASYNSIATAEGMIAELIKSFPCNLHGKEVLLLGYGKCGKTLAAKLKALDMRVSVCVRRKEAAMEAFSMGNHTISFHHLIREIPKYPIVINTVPERIFGKEERKVFHKGTRLYELASYPYCMDPDAAREEGILLEICGALPGKYSPVSSAMILKDYILNSITEANLEISDRI